MRRTLRLDKPVLDVACGTGVVAREAAKRLAEPGQIVGLDVNEGMLTVADRLRPDIEWRQGDAGDLPFEDGSFERVLCQSALMFFPDPAQALREMARVVTVDGTAVRTPLTSSARIGPSVILISLLHCSRRQA
jgi:ubiquinone/menaquinone biosynthesis C-methylase UbiE